MEFLLLGPFEARAGGRRVEVAKRRQERCLLAILLLEAGRLVTFDRLADLLWDGSPPASARSAIHTYVGRLRTALQSGVAIETRGDGYLLRAEDVRIDAREFTALAYRGGAMSDPAERVRLLRQAIGLWRGPLLSDIADDRLRQRLGGDLTELYLSSVELKAEAQLTLGLHDQVLTDLGPLATPYRERTVALLMTAMHHCGRISDALALYRSTRAALAEELGIEPGPELRSLHEQILRNEAPPPPRPIPAYAVEVHGHWLPWAVGGHPALEFCNTRAGWRGPPVPSGEWLRSYEALAVWAGYHDLADDSTVSALIERAADDPAEAESVLRDARVLRTRLYQALTDVEDEGAFEAVAKYADDAARFAVFGRGADGLGRWTLPASTGLRLPIHAVARSAADLLSDPRRFTIRACPGWHCGWLFLDAIGQRRWCTMFTCGLTD